jgi:hypothetical protein
MSIFSSILISKWAKNAVQLKQMNISQKSLNETVSTWLLRELAMKALLSIIVPHHEFHTLLAVS